MEDENELEDALIETLMLTNDSHSSTSTTLSSSFDSDSSVEGLLKEKHKYNRILNFLATVAKYNDFEFKQHFRVRHGTADFLIGLVSTAGIMAKVVYGRENITAEKAVLLTLWYLANAETFRQVSDRFNMAKSAAHGTIKRVITHLAFVCNDYIKFPVGNGAVDTEQGFRRRAGFPGVVGAIDSTHIRLKKPINDQEAYFNRKKYHSIILQVICDHKKRFLNIFCGEAGSQHDGRVLRKSSVYEKGQNGQLNIGQNFILGDSAYPCLSWLIPPFKNAENLTANHVTFNNRHSRTRVVVENAFGLLKTRFRRLLHGFSNTDIRYVVLCVICACVLHNICINFDDLDIAYEEYLDGHEEDNPEEVQYYDVDVENRRNLLFEEMFNQQ